MNNADDWYWSGLLNAANAHAVADRIRRTLTGRRYTFVSYNAGFEPSSGIGLDVRTDQRLTRSTSGDPVVLTITDDKPHIHVCDTYGVWGISQFSGDRGDVYFCFDGERMQFEHYAPAGHRLVWKVVPQRAVND